MRIIQLMFLAFILVGHRVAVAADASTTTTRVHALLVIASGQKGQSDARLSAYEPTLRRVLRFESYTLAGEASANMPSLGKSSVSLGRGHSLTLESQKAEVGGVRLQISWQEGGRMLMNTGIVPRPGVPTVLGGPSTGKPGEAWAVIVIAD
jgi:hypothetical protein